MSVYTQLSLAQIQNFAQNYALDIHQIQPIQNGVENTNYFLTTTQQQQYVLTIFEEISHHAAQELPPVLQFLAQQHLPVAVPLIYQQQYIHTIHHKPAQIAPRLTGTSPEHPNLTQIQTMGETLARLHLALQQYQQHYPDFQRKNNHDQHWWEQATQQLTTIMSTDDQLLLATFLQQLQQMTRQYPQRPQGLIHADLFRDNVLFTQDHLTGILDFSELHHDELLLDIAICLNDFCSDFPKTQLNHDKAHHFLTAYQTIRPFTSDEKYCLNLYLAFSACRFWLSRLQTQIRNQQEGRIHQHILQKDPNEMKSMFIHRLEQINQILI